MPRDSGKLYSGTAESGSGSEGSDLDHHRGQDLHRDLGVDVAAQHHRLFAPASAGDWGGWHGGGGGAMVTVDNPQGGEAKALLSASDGSGLRCDLRSGGYSTGGGVCRDDRGREYDVQVRPAPKT